MTDWNEAAVREALADRSRVAGDAVATGLARVRRCDQEAVMRVLSAIALAAIISGPGECTPEDAYQQCADLAVQVGELECRSDPGLCGAAPCEGWSLAHCANVWARDRVLDVCRVAP